MSKRRGGDDIVGLVESDNEWLNDSALVDAHMEALREDSTREAIKEMLLRGVCTGVSHKLRRGETLYLLETR